MRHRNGFALMELTVALAVLATTLPAITQTLLGTQRYLHDRISEITSTHERRYCAQFVRRDVHNAVSFEIIGPEQLIMTDSQGRSLRYFLENGQFKRRQTQWQNGKATTSTQILNTRWPVTQLSVTHPTPRIIRFTLGIPSTPQQWDIFAPHGQ